MANIIYEAQPTVNVVCHKCGLVDRVFRDDLMRMLGGVRYDQALARHYRSEAHKEASK